jgi:lysophospholipase L1-like esterase
VNSGVFSVAIGWIVALTPLTTLAANPQQENTKAFSGIRHGQRVLFLGDSNTFNGSYIQYLDAYLFTQFPNKKFELINLGLPSETVSGLSEPDHPYPRPNVHERLERTLAKIRPDVVYACYGMNDGIYYPFDQARFDKYQQGMRKLIERVRASGAQLALMTPPVFDVRPVRAVAKPAGESKYSWMAPFDEYDTVLQRYSDWLLTLNEPALPVLDLHEAMRSYLDAVRQSDPKYQLSGDGVHFGPTGHWLVAEQILKSWHFHTRAEGLFVKFTGDERHAADGKVLIASDKDSSMTVKWTPRMPMPIDPRWDQQLIARDQTGDWNSFRLTVTDLSERHYDVLEGEHLLGTPSREELGNGVNLLQFNKLSTVQRSQELLKLVIQRQEILSLAWLNAVGFKRPGTPAGLPLEEARQKASELEAKIRKLAHPTEIALTIRPAR